MNCPRFVNVINSTTTINAFNSDYSNIAKIKTTPSNQDNHCKFKPMIKISIIYSLVLLLLATSISSRSQFYCNTTFIKHIHQNQKENQT